MINNLKQTQKIQDSKTINIIWQIEKVFPVLFFVFLSTITLLKSITIIFFNDTADIPFIMYLTPLYLCGFAHGHLVIMSAIVTTSIAYCQIKGTPKYILVSFIPISVILSSITYELLQPNTLCISHGVLFIGLLFALLLDIAYLLNIPLAKEQQKIYKVKPIKKVDILQYQQYQQYDNYIMQQKLKELQHIIEQIQKIQENLYNQQKMEKKNE